jgi:predicted HNH restriction endonuclease
MPGKHSSKTPEQIEKRRTYNREYARAYRQRSKVARHEIEQRYRDKPQSKKRQSEYGRKRYLENKKEHCQKTRERSAKIKTVFDDIKQKAGCKFCGENDPICLDFHHDDRETKVESVSTLARRGRLEDAIAEAKKCEVICSNCHRKLHRDRGDYQPRTGKRKGRLPGGHYDEDQRDYQGGKQTPGANGQVFDGQQRLFDW